MPDSLKPQYDCRHFLGYIPCKPHKQHGVECRDGCEYFLPASGNVLIIKLGAMGDVIRTTPLLRKIRMEYPEARIFCLTRYPEILPELVDRPLPFNLESLTWIHSIQFELVVNLDKDPEACALLEQCKGEEKAGFGLARGMPAPVNKAAVHKFLTGISDSLSKKNRKHYLEEIFEICGWPFKGETYSLPREKENQEITAFHSDRKIIGLNTGCGSRWTTRLWPEEYWVRLIRKLMERGYQPLILGGPEEDEKNRRLALDTGAPYLGVFPILEFISLVKKCDLLVTAVTMAMHIAIGLERPLVLLNNIFNPHEFYFYRKSIIVSPDKTCDCYYLSECLHGQSCMRELSVDSVLDAIETVAS